MNPDKRVKKETAQLENRDDAWQAVEDDEPAEYRQRVQMIVWRAVMVYIVLLFGVGATMSILGVNPLANNGLMPKAILIFVGLSLLIALINTLTDFSQEHGRSWLRLISRWVRPGKR